jgi:hypothetical protein
MEVVDGQRITRRAFLRRYGIASSALTLSPFFIERLTALAQASAGSTRVYKVKNGDCFQNIAKLWDMLDGPGKYIGPTDVVVIKANAQWPNQGYTHTGCIKAVIDRILQIPGFSGEVLICDDLQASVGSGGWQPGAVGFDATADKRARNWPDKNWNELAADYQSNHKPVATLRWMNGPWRSGSFPSLSTWNPANGPGWGRSFFSYNGRPTFLSYPVFASPLTRGRMIDMRSGVWESGAYTGRKVKALFMPTLNNHGDGNEDYAGITSAIKSFYGATEIPVWQDDTWNGYYHIHSSSFTQSAAFSAGELVGRFINTLYAPVLYITAAMFSGWYNRTDVAAQTNTVLACENPASLDYISSRDVISPYASWLNPDQDSHTRQQILGANSQGIGTIDPTKLQVISYDFLNPTATRLDVERKMRDYKAGKATEQDVKDVIKLYMDNGS